MTTDTATSGLFGTREARGKATVMTVPTPQLLILSEVSEDALDQATSQLREYLSHDDSVRMGDVGFTLQTECRNLVHRRMLVCSGREDAISVLADGNPNRLLSSRLDGARRAAVLMLPGVGDQYVGMGYGLYMTWEVFREEVDRCAHILEPHLGIDIRTVLYPASGSWKNVASAKGIDLKRMLGRSANDPPDPDTARLNTTLFAQPALFTVEYAIARLWLSLGITPDALIGHSMGEYVAACLAGVLSLEDALRLIAVRARLVHALPEAVMLATMLPEEDLRSILPPGLFISLINGPSHCVVAGSPAEVTAFEVTLKQREVIARRVQNGHAFHTPLLEPILEPFMAEVRAIRLREPRIPYISNVTGDWVTASQATEPSYWIKHATHTARFSDGLRRMWQLHNPALIECGPGKTLNVLAAQHPDRKGTLRSAIWSMRQRYENERDDQVLLAAIGKVWLAGGPIAGERLPRFGEPRRIALRGSGTDAVSPGGGDACGPPPSLRADLVREEEVAAKNGWTDEDKPANDRERQLLAIWRTALGRERIGVNDSFGALGGDSLSSVGAILEMQRAGFPDKITRGLYRGLTIRQMAQLATAEGDLPHTGRIGLCSIEMPVFVRAIAIFIVCASHFGLTTLSGNPALMIVSGLNFAKFQMQTVDKERSVRPIFRLMLRLAIPCFLWTVGCQLVHYAFAGVRPDIRSWFFIDNLIDPEPYSLYESPWFIDLLFQCWLIMALVLSVRAVRQFALKRAYSFGLIFLLLSWGMSVIVPPLIDPSRTWTQVPQLYLWLMALGWCVAYGRSNRQKILTTVIVLGLNAVDLLLGMHDGLHSTLVAGLILVGFDYLPVRLPKPLVQVAVALAGASLFIYLTHWPFDHLLGLVWTDRPRIVRVAWAMFGGFAVWTLWNHISRVTIQWSRKMGVGESADLRVGAADG
jgi:malonyl CoA-acyl carrier protein transacylase